MNVRGDFLKNFKRTAKTNFLRCIGYLSSIKPYKARFIAISSSCATTELSKLLNSCLTAVKNKTCHKVLCGQVKICGILKILVK